MLGIKDGKRPDIGLMFPHPGVCELLHVHCGVGHCVSQRRGYASLCDAVNVLINP